MKNEQHYEVQIADRRVWHRGESTKQFKVVFRFGPQPWHCETVRYFRDKAKAEVFAAKRNELLDREARQSAQPTGDQNG